MKFSQGEDRNAHTQERGCYRDKAPWAMANVGKISTVSSWKVAWKRTKSLESGSRLCHDYAWANHTL